MVFALLTLDRAMVDKLRVHSEEQDSTEQEGYAQRCARSSSYSAG